MKLDDFIAIALVGGLVFIGGALFTILVPALSSHSFGACYIEKESNPLIVDVVQYCKETSGLATRKDER